jgi:hypothetical protein
MNYSYVIILLVISILILNIFTKTKTGFQNKDTRYNWSSDLIKRFTPFYIYYASPKRRFLRH